MIDLGAVQYNASPWGNRFHQQRDLTGRVVDEILGAGASGPGKTEVLIHDPLVQMAKEAERQSLPEEHPDYVEPGASKGHALLLRRSTNMLRDLIARARPVYTKVNGGVDGWSETNKTFTFKCGYRVTLGHCYERDDINNYVGVSWTWIGFDELIQFLEEQYQTIKLWLRSDDHILAQDLRVRSASNPVFTRKDSDDFTIEDPFWVRKYFVEPAPDGNEIIVTRTFANRPNTYYFDGDLVKARVVPANDNVVPMPETCTVLEADHERNMYRLARGDVRADAKKAEGEWFPYSSLAGKFYERSRLYMPATIDDNPDPVYREAQKRNLLGSPKHVREALLEGNWFYQVGGYFEDAWLPEIHVVDPYPLPRHGWRFWRSLDWGHMTPGVCLWYAMGPDENIVVFGEYTFQGFDAEYVGKEILKRDKALKFTYGKRSLLTGVADTQLWEKRGDGGITKAATMKKLGVDWRGATKDRQANAEYLYKRLTDHEGGTRKPGLTIFSTCKLTIRHAFSIMADPKEPNVPKKGGNDHHYDSLSYGVRFAQRGLSGIPSLSARRRRLEKRVATPHSRGIDGYGG